MKLVRYLMSVVVLASMVGCASGGRVVETAPPDEMLSIAEYQIGVGDVLDVNVWRNEDLTRSVLVRPDGKISLPLVGDVIAAGTTARDLSATLQDKFLNFIRNPQVTIIVSSADSAEFANRIRVTGAVQNPISTAYRKGMTVLDLVLEAGGLTEFALADKALLFRKSPDGVKAYTVRLGDILNKGKLETNYSLAPSDIITIPERSF